ncbi:MAG: flagellar basal body-associated FliL family protein [Opitutae bacterium]|nr:flagellar basal body-associated FliL family protein [Opitutae bacterium]
MAKADAKEKTEAAPAADKSAPAPAPVEETGKSAGAGALLRAWLPAFIAVLLAPVACWGVAEFVLLPRLQKKLAALPAAGSHAAANEASAEGEGKEGEKGHGEGKEGGGSGNYDFNNVVVNLAGTMGTRYLKTSFVVTPAEKGASLKSVFEGQKAKLTDITLNVLSSLTLADLEEPGAKNVLREKLVAAYNQALGKRVVEQVYFSDFVIQ